MLGRLPERVGGRELYGEGGRLPSSLFCLLTGHSLCLLLSPPRLLGRESLHNTQTQSQIKKLHEDLHVSKSMLVFLLTKTNDLDGFTDL